MELTLVIKQVRTKGIEILDPIYTERERCSWKMGMGPIVASLGATLAALQ